MSVQSEIERITGNIANAYDALETKGVVVPETKNSAGLAQTITDMPALYTAYKGQAGRVTVANQSGTISVYPTKVALGENALILTLTVSGNATRSTSFSGTGTVEIRF